MLQIEQLSKRYGSKVILDRLNLYLKPGEIYGLLGPNGAGKTTTINLICGLLKADTGTVRIGGQPASGATKSLIGVMPQQNLLYQSLTCAENLGFFGRIYGLPRSLRRQRIAACLTAVNLLDRAKTPVEQLSGGMQRRLSLAVAIMHQPQLLILDEPTTGLDIEARREVWQLIRGLKQQGMTVLLTTHLLDEVEKLCQRIGIIKQGRLLAEGSLADLRQWLPAEEIVTVETPDGERAIAAGRTHGFTPRWYGSELTFWIPEKLELRELLDRFEGVRLDAISRQPVGLEHIYLEITQTAEQEDRG
ncbi:ABC transporter ATP-binding protein [filamentous cyanobacterium CCP5]|nr:ABC transporter ATP-binding protein [filamentous cyanobacterium CCP5]